MIIRIFVYRCMTSNNILSLKGAMESKIASYTLEFIMYKVGLRLTLNVFVTHPGIMCKNDFLFYVTIA